ncbi:hypothetical protein STEG23_020751 [Scotinomys teguina]
MVLVIFLRTSSGETFIPSNSITAINMMRENVHVDWLFVALKSTTYAHIPNRNKLRKTQKLRGHMSHGHGRISKHCKHPGGHGNAGGMHQHRINLDKYRRGNFGNAGMRHYQLKRKQSFCPAVNLGKLWTLVSEQTRVNAANKEQDWSCSHH